MTQKEIKDSLEKIEKIDVLEQEINLLLSQGISEKVLSKFINKVNKHRKKEEKNRKMKETELKYLTSGYDYVLGIDEVGRGPLAGPVVASCVMMDKDSFLLDVDDSKKLSEETREELFDKIKTGAKVYATGMISSDEIDEINILNATFKAMNEAYLKATKDIDKDAKVLVLIDGNLKNPLIKCNQIPIVKGDSKCYSIACASILAKVTRDRMMNELDKAYPDYDFINNKGYGTEKHRNALKEKGQIEGIHRKSFITNLI